MKRTVLILTTLTALMVSASSFAATATANLPINASVNANCTISTVGVNFGVYDPIGVNAAANLDQTGTVTVTCTKGSGLSIDLGLGANASGAIRRMNDGSGNMMTYELYSDNGRTTVWGSGASGLAIAAAPSKVARSYTVYGRVPSAQDVSAGNYSDTVVATINY